MKNFTLGRRQFLTWGAALVAGVPFLFGKKNLIAQAEAAKAKASGAAKCGPKPKDATLKFADPAGTTEKSLAFTNEVPANFKHAVYKAGSLCSGCQFYGTAKAKEGWAPCMILADAFVPGCGWCSAYSPAAKDAKAKS